MELWVQKLLDWYDKNKRDLPWRKSRDPYAIWVSEIMLQQTRVEAVRDYYQIWLERFPDIRSLAAADQDVVLKTWEGLGYYSRARNLHKAARMIMAEWDGTFPSSYQQSISLPGIGPYTAGAIMSIAFGQPVPAVDGNVLRVMSRFFAWPEIEERNVQAKIRLMVAESFPPGREGEFTQALMELGALVCIPRHPDCSRCPLTDECQAFQQKRQSEWPVMKKKAPVKEIQRLVAVIKQGDLILMHRRPATGLLAGLWEFPGVEGRLKKELAARFEEEYKLKLKIGRHLIDARHVFTHIEWQMKVYEATLAKGEDLSRKLDFKWVSRDELEKLAIPTAFHQIKRAL